MTLERLGSTDPSGVGGRQLPDRSTLAGPFGIRIDFPDPSPRRVDVFITELTQHIPDPRTHLVRYFGFYSNKSLGMPGKTARDALRVQ